MRPLLPIVIAFAVGIATQNYALLSVSATIALFGISIAALLCLFFLRVKYSGHFTPLPFFFLGLLFITPQLRPALPQNHIRNFIVHEDDKALKKVRLTGIEGTVTGLPEFINDRAKYVVNTDRALLPEGQWEDTTGAVLVTTEDETINLKPGYRVRFFARLKEPANYGNPGEYDGKWRLNSKGIFVTARVNDARHIEKLTDSPRGFFGMVEAFRSQVRTLIDNSGAMHKEPLKALIIAEKGGIEKTIREAYVKTGTAHILAISGLHVGMVALFSYAIIIFLLKRSERLILLLNIKKTAATLSLVPVIGYGLLAGFPVSAERAVIMAVAGIVTLLLNRGRDYLNILSLAGLAILAIEPSALWDISFQLTFAAVGAIIYFVPKFTELAKLQVKAEAGKTAGKPNLRERTIKKFKRWFLLACVTTLSATLGTSPLIAYHFSRISLAGAFANLLVVPLAGVAVPLLMVSAVVMPLSHWLANLLLYPAGWAFELMTLIARIFAALPYSSAWVSRPTVIEIALFYVSLFSIVNIRQVQYRRIWRGITVASLLTLAVSFSYWSLSPKWNRDLKVTFISVGQGESTLVEFPGGKTMLIDGGGLYGTEFDTGERLVAPFLRHKKISTIDYMVLSHAQRDHMAGLDYVAKNFNVKEFWWNNDGRLGRLENTLKENGTVTKLVNASTKKADINGVDVEVLAPWSDSGFDQNNNCLVLRLTYKDNSFLFTGDIGEPMETALIKSSKLLKTTVLKAPHHGSRYSSSWLFLNAVSPSFVVASVGKDNVFGFPHPDTLEKYNRLGATVLRTDKHGAIELTTDGSTLSVLQYLTPALQ